MKYDRCETHPFLIPRRFGFPATRSARNSPMASQDALKADFSVSRWGDSFEANTSNPSSQVFRTGLQSPNADVMHVRKLSGDVTSSALRKAAAQTFVGNLREQKQIDAIVCMPRFQYLINHTNSTR